MDGAWDVSLDGGPVQRWNISQTGCDVALSSDPAGGYICAGVTGVAGSTGFWASWTCTEGACRSYYRLDANVAGNALTGTMAWSQGSYGNGYCPAIGTTMKTVSGTRR